jgi:hypothetical protein
MSTSIASPLARCKALALARMIEAGGKPCWVATYAADDSAAALPCSPPKARKPSLLPQYRPRRSSLDEVPRSGEAAPAAAPIGAGAAPDVSAPATALERAWLASVGRMPGRGDPGQEWEPLAVAAGLRRSAHADGVRG